VITKLSGGGKEADQQWAVDDEFTILRWMAWLEDNGDIEYLKDRLRRRRIQPAPIEDAAG
jgi:hypothetical protein